MPNGENENASTARVASRYQPLVVIVIALCGGIGLDAAFLLSTITWWTVAVGAWSLWLLLWWRQLDRSAAVFLLLAVASSGGAWHHARWNNFAADDVGCVASEMRAPIYVECVAITGPRWSPAPPADSMRTIPRMDETRILLRAEKARDGTEWRAVSGRVELTVPGRLNGVQAGDRLRVLAMISRPAVPRNPGEFDYSRYLRSKRQLCRLATPSAQCISVVEEGSPWSFRRLVGSVRQRCSDLIWKYVSHERAALASAVLLGAREQLNRERTDAFFTTGTVHLLAISGLHVGILAYGFWLLARLGFLPRRWTLIAAMVFVMVYAVLTDSRPPVVRATILITAFCTARIFGRQAMSFNTLAAAALIVLVMNPVQLFQTGTQLSFLAVATLMCCSPLLTRRVTTDPLDRLIDQSRPPLVRFARRFAGAVYRLWLTSTVIWLAALPLVLLRFHIVTPVAIFLNPLLMLPIAVALFSGFGVLVFGNLLPPLGALCGWVCDGSLAVIESLIQVAQPLPGSHIWLPSPQVWWVVGLYSALAIAIAFPQLRPKRRWGVALLALWLLVGAATSSTAQRPKETNDQPELTCTFIAVGHGTSVLIEFPDGTTMLYDAGRFGSPAAGARSIAGVLWDRGITHLDAVVVSHADGDHYNALPELLTRVDIGVVYFSPVMFDDESDALDDLQASLARANVPVRHLYSGQYLAADPAVQVAVLHPPREGVAAKDRDKDNANSIVLLIEFAGRKILLPGDLVSPAIEDVLAEEPIDCDVVMAPHHGSAGSDPRAFSEWSQPEFVVISASTRYDLTDVKQIWREAGAEVLHTAIDGAVQVKVSEAELKVRTWRGDPW